MEILYYILTFLVAGFIALGSLGKKYSNAATQREKFLNIAVFSLLIGAAMWIVFAFVNEPINQTVVLYAAAFGVNYVVCNFALYAAMELGSLSKTNLFNSLSLVIPTLTGVIFWHEEFNAWMLVSALVLMIASLSLIILKREEGTEEEKAAFDAANNNKVTYQRYKGLGEMSTEQLWDTTMNPATRTLVKVSMKDAVEADKMFTILMGESPALRRKFIEDNATLVKDLDV